MKIRKAVITAAGRQQRALPVQTLVDRDGVEKSILAILVEETRAAGIEEVAVVIAPEDEDAFSRAAGPHGSGLRFIPQPEPRGYGHAIRCAAAFTRDDPFLHLVGDHLYVSADDTGCAQRLVAIAEREECSVSAVQSTREHLLPYYGAIGGRRLPEQPDLYAVETVLEKPTPTEAELRLVVPGLRAGHYLCFFGMHVLTPSIMALLAELESRSPVQLSSALQALAAREKYLAYELPARRFDVGVKYGLLTAQLALALAGSDREEVLARVLDVLAQRELAR